MSLHVDKPQFRSADHPSGINATHAVAAGLSPKPLPAHKPTNAAVAAADYAKLVAKLKAGGRDPHLLNTLGVYQMRLGHYSEAVNTYRGFVLQAGCIWERLDIAAAYKRNFATALLLAGFPGGCLSVLHALGEPDHPRSRELLVAIKNWEKTLPFFQRWDWRLNWVAPKNCSIPVDFVPGELE